MNLRKSKYFVLLIILLFAGVVQSCISDEISTSPSHILTFSRDTVSFDTIFTEQGTTTARLIVRNNNDKGVMISHIGFKDPETRYRLNVDGFSGTTFSDVEIRANDSIYVFIECYPKHVPNSQPYLIEDKLEFITNGVTQDVVVEAWGQNVTRLKATTITEDMTLTAEQPYVIYDSLVVAKGAKLKIEPGAKVLFHDKAGMVVRGTLEAKGAVGKMIDMRGDRLDNVLPDVSYDLLAGQWKGIRIASESFDNRMEFVNMRSTSEGLKIDSCGNLDRSKLILVNSWLHNSQSTVLDSSHAMVDAYGCVFSEAANAVINLTGGSHNFIQCTVSNYYLFAAITEPMVCLHYLFEDDYNGVNPLMYAVFANSILYGMAPELNYAETTDSDVYFLNVLFRSEGFDDTNFFDCVWDSDPLFYTDRSEYIFNYRLRPDSPAIGKGNPEFIGQISLYDMDGMNRLANGLPDLGAYVFKPEPENDESE